MAQTDIASEHKDVKQDAYWENLVGGNTAAYKEQKIIELLDQFAPSQVDKMIDIGVGTCDFMFRLKDKLGAQSFTCMDYDAGAIDELKAKYPNEDVEWLVADVFKLKEVGKKFDLVFLLDVVHEIYSFYGRPNRDINQEVDHQKGLGYVEELLKNVTDVTTEKGLIAISDNVLCEENKDIRVRLKTPEVIETVKYFLANYPTKKIPVSWVSGDEITINSRDFCVLLTQYNKIKNKKMDRWAIERMEIHQYYTLSEYQEVFGKFGFKVEAVVGTPDDAGAEWPADFEVTEGLSVLPQKRITLVAHR